MQTIALRWKLLLALGILAGILLTLTALTISPLKTSALTATQSSLTPTPFFRFPVVPNAEISGFFDHHGTYPGDLKCTPWTGHMLGRCKQHLGWKWKSETNRPADRSPGLSLGGQPHHRPARESGQMHLTYPTAVWAK